ncbi:putative cAMP-dependent protein kinase catalytic subunit [Blumeria hordei DH14]|uniref:non-specific serine/threonine protein kinase n=1 Tax=Blumeria graminis f. sp. hordei (strain DH14) TaxID=546991 RepID=N1J7R9_BLUG1|nr:putative cAMP-dependent protein kinase catalytic subunit [Blumeria hordei DH14]
MTRNEMDLLKQATQSMMFSNHDDQNDSDTGNQTPRSGFATPRPDPADKRLPGILYSYFGQVGSVSSALPSHSKHDPLSFGLAEANDLSPPKLEKLYTSQPPSFIPLAPAEGLPTKEGARNAQSSESDNSKTTHPYPTPPVSHTNSFRNIMGEINSEEEDPIIRNANVSQLSCGFISLQETCPRSAPSIARSQSIAPLASNSVVMQNSSLLSNSINLSKQNKSGPRPHSSLGSEISSSHSTQQSKQKARPISQKSFPLSPTHALSNSTAKSAASCSSDIVNVNGKVITAANLATEASNSPTPIPSASAPVVKGRLVVKLVKARNIRSCKDPYVVAVFQRNELVSKGPLSEGQDREKAVTSIPVIEGYPIARTTSDSGRPMAIPMKSRQSSNTSISDHRDFKKVNKIVTHPLWDTEAVFDVVDSDSRVLITIYDRGTVAEEFIGQVDLKANLTEKEGSQISGWFPLRGRNDADTGNLGEINVEINFQPTEKKHYGPEDFQILKLIGKGTFGQVYQVRKKDTKRIYAMKVLQKKVIVQKKEVAHTLGERNILVRTAMTDSPFIVGLKFSFQTPTDLYLVTDYMSGGELFWHLQKEGRFDERRAKFYVAELILALQHLHMHGIVYRDLKPENILLDANGHVALCDFGLSKANLTKDDKTKTFCGTTEYLAPEVLLDEIGYTKMVDFWSLGVLVFEMCCGWSPFYAEDTQQMYKNIAFGKVRFPRDTLTTEGRNFVKGLLNRNPRNRLGAINEAEELKRHPFFADIDWELLTAKKITPPFKPKLKSVTDTSNFDPEFTNALNDAGSLNARAAALAAGIATSTPLSPGVQASFEGFTFVDESAMDDYMNGIGIGNNWENIDDDDDNERRNNDDNFGSNNLQTVRTVHMSGVVRGDGIGIEDSPMFNGGHFDM